MKKHSFYRVKVAVLPCESYAFTVWNIQKRGKRAFFEISEKSRFLYFAF